MLAVPTCISDAIYQRVDEFLKSNPEVKASREEIYNDMLSAFIEFGVIPDIEPRHPEVK